MLKQNKRIKFFYGTSGIKYENKLIRVSRAFFISGLLLLIISITLSYFNSLIIFSFVFFLIVALISFLRIRFSLRELTKLIPKKNDLKIFKGWDGTGKFLRFMGIPLDNYGLILGVILGLFVVPRYFDNFEWIILNFLLIILSGIFAGISIFYFVLEFKNRCRIYSYRYRFV
ncbi:MAG: hypothetical protein PHF67_03400 [Candidatus Nanoarchaeia archaeon]|nr:hypothetical protein [Candidatus Nanoarchaeia archaeon]